MFSEVCAFILSRMRDAQVLRGTGPKGSPGPMCLLACTLGVCQRSSLVQLVLHGARTKGRPRVRHDSLAGGLALGRSMPTVYGRAAHLTHLRVFWDSYDVAHRPNSKVRPIFPDIPKYLEIPS